MAHWSHDPTYVRNRAVLKARARRNHEPCARCGGAIEWSGPRGPWSFDAGHIIALALGGDHSLANLQPEHQRCNRLAGAELGNERKRAVQARPDTARYW